MMLSGMFEMQSLISFCRQRERPMEKWTEQDKEDWIKESQKIRQSIKDRKVIKTPEDCNKYLAGSISTARIEQMKAVEIKSKQEFNEWWNDPKNQNKKLKVRSIDQNGKFVEPTEELRSDLNTRIRTVWSLEGDEENAWIIN